MFLVSVKLDYTPEIPWKFDLDLLIFKKIKIRDLDLV